MRRSAIINGIQWVQQHAKAKNISTAVISMSLGGPTSPSLNDAVEAAVADGVVVVVAAGNDNGDACQVSPASAPNAITVGASTETDGKASFSNWGTCLDVWVRRAVKAFVALRVSCLGDGPTT